MNRVRLGSASAKTHLIADAGPGGPMARRCTMEHQPSRPLRDLLAAYQAAAADLSRAIERSPTFGDQLAAQSEPYPTDTYPVEPRVPLQINLPANAIFLSGQTIVIEIASSLATLIERAERTGRAPFVKQPDDALNDAVTRLRDERLANGKRRTWKEVQAELKKMNSAWAFTSDGAVRKRYARNKDKRSTG
jgi:hypothetical protein